MAKARQGLVILLSRDQSPPARQTAVGLRAGRGDNSIFNDELPTSSDVGTNDPKGISDFSPIE